MSFLAPEEAVLEAMLGGWVAQQRSRLLVASTVEQRVLVVRRFVAFSSDYPWQWSPGDVEEWTTSLVSQGLAHSTIRNYQQAVQLFCGYLTDRRYGWDEVCEQRFGTHPVQVCHEWNMAVHRSEVEARPGNRPLSREELQRFLIIATTGWALCTPAAGKDGWRRSGTPRCSRPSTGGVCAVGKLRCSSWPTCPATRTPRNSGGTVRCRCGTARR